MVTSVRGLLAKSPTQTLYASLRKRRPAALISTVEMVGLKPIIQQGFNGRPSLGRFLKLSNRSPTKPTESFNVSMSVSIMALSPYFSFTISRSSCSISSWRASSILNWVRKLAKTRNSSRKVTHSRWRPRKLWCKSDASHPWISAYRFLTLFRFEWLRKCKRAPLGRV